MAISRQKKQTQVSELVALLGNAKLTAVAKYQGLTVKELQSLRRAATAADVTIKVVKNRLVRVAMGQVAGLKDSDSSLLEGQLLYAISSADEVAPAQVLARFAKEHEALQMVTGYNTEGLIISPDDL